MSANDLVVELPTVNKKLVKRGIVYLSSLPPYLNVSQIREIFSEYGDLGRVYLQLPGIFINTVVDKNIAYIFIFYYTKALIFNLENVCYYSKVGFETLSEISTRLAIHRPIILKPIYVFKLHYLQLCETCIEHLKENQ